MPTNSGSTSLQGLSFPTLPDPAHPDNQKELAQQLDSRVVMRFPSAAGRDAAINAPAVGMTAHLADAGKLTSYSAAGQWVEVAGSGALRPPVCSVSSHSTQAIPKDVFVAISHDAIEIDTDGMANASERGVITCQTAGIYRATASCFFDPVNPGAFCVVGIGATGRQLISVGMDSIGPNDYGAPTCDVVVTLAVGDTLDVQVRQSSAASLGLQTAFGIASVTLTAELVSL